MSLRKNKKYNLLIFFVFLFLPHQIFADFSFLTNLKVGLSSTDILELQKILNKDPRTLVATAGLGSPGFETAYFGAKTKDAVMRFQEIYRSEILDPSGLSFPTGYVGNATRAKLNELIFPNLASQNTGQNPSSTNVSMNTSTPGKLAIISVSPSTFNDGETVEISGSSFENINTIAFGFAPDEIVVGNSLDGKTMSVALATTMGKEIRKTLDNVKSKSPSAIYSLIFESMQNNFGGMGRDGVYLSTTLTVKNSKGTSNPMSITIKIANK